MQASWSRASRPAGRADAIVEGARAIVTGDPAPPGRGGGNERGYLGPAARAAPAPAQTWCARGRRRHGEPDPRGAGMGGMAAAGCCCPVPPHRPRNAGLADDDDAAGQSCRRRAPPSGEKAEEASAAWTTNIWSCRCGQALKLRYGSLFTSYGKCRSCQAKTLKATTTTLVSATTSSEGRARVDERCEHCSYTNSYERSIPRIQERSSSSSSSSSRGSSSGRGSSGSW